MTKAVWGAGLRAAGLAAVILAQASCGSLTTQGTGSSYLTISKLEAAQGADPGKFSGTLDSDVITVKDGAAGIYADFGRATLKLALKDPGSSGSPNSPTPNNYITVDRYRVEYRRTDGRNTQGVDVPYSFDSAATATVSDEAEIVFLIVRHQAKEEAPLKALGTNNLIFSTIATVTFYGHDQTGREASVSGNIGIGFANYADPK
jgi:hypothetical protein